MRVGVQFPRRVRRGPRRCEGVQEARRGHETGLVVSISASTFWTTLELHEEQLVRPQPSSRTRDAEGACQHGRLLSLSGATNRGFFFTQLSISWSHSQPPGVFLIQE